MLTVENLYQSYGDKVLFADINCTIEPYDRIGLIGVNGTGKSSFLKVIAQIDKPEKGHIKHADDYVIEYLEQEPELQSNQSVIDQIYAGDSVIMKTMRQYEQALSRLEKNSQNEAAQKHLLNMQEEMDKTGAWEANTEAKTILTKLGVTDFDKPVSELSGGQQKRVALAKALIQPADLLILDEPTNHLDNDTIAWLETYLTSYEGAILLVTHDRYFLNRVTTIIFELDQGNFYRYEGNYEVFLEKKAEREALEVSDQQKHENLLRRELAWIRRGARARSTKQRARVERVEALQEKKQHQTHRSLDMKVGATRLGKQVLELENISKSFADKQIVTAFSHLFKRGDKVGIIGPNGSGKTTLLNMMAGRMKPDTGQVTVGETVKIGYYVQDDSDLDGDQRIIDYIRNVAEVIHTKNGETITAEQMLEHFLFSRPMQWTYIRKLSGGEKRRLYLLKILMTEPNVLFLDEPTNDLDTQTLSILEEYLHVFPGVVITVSHDRYFLDRVVDQLLVFQPDQHIELFYGNYSEFLAAQPAKETKQPREKKTRKPTKRKQRLSYNEQREWEHIEDDITALEEALENMSEKISAAGSNVEKVQSLFSEQEQLEQLLEHKMERWEELSLRIEMIGNQS